MDLVFWDAAEAWTFVTSDVAYALGWRGDLATTCAVVTSRTDMGG